MYDYFVWQNTKKKKKKNDNDSISSILYDYYDIQILKKIFFIQSIVFMIILMKFSPPPQIGNEFFNQYQ